MALILIHHVCTCTQDPLRRVIMLVHNFTTLFEGKWAAWVGGEGAWPPS